MRSEAKAKWVVSVILAGLAWVSTTSANAQGLLRAAWGDAQRSEALPTVHTSLRVDVDRQYAHVRLDQQFRNPTDTELEARYTLRTGAHASVVGFAYYNGEQRIVGEVFEKQVAREIYEDVTGQGRDPGLLEQEGEGQFGFRVFPLLPEEIKRVQVQLGQWLPQHGNTVSFVMPWQGGEDVRIDLRDERGIAAVRSDTHALQVRRRSDGELFVQVGARRIPGDTLSLHYELKRPALELSAAVHRDADHDGYVMLHLATPERARDSAVAAKDVTLVIDRSGSMQGQPLQSARRAALALIERLSSEDRLNVVAFDDQAERLFRTPRRLSAATREQARRFVEGLDSGGGTNIAAALTSAFEAQVHDEQPNVVLFLTDGESDSAAALQAARADRSDARLFTVGLGNGVDKPLLSRLAADKRGRFTFIPSQQAIEPVVQQLFTRISAPLLVDLRLGVEGGRLARIYPRSLPDVFVDDELRVLARFVPEPATDAPLRVWLEAKFEGRDVRYETVITRAPVRRPWVGRSWASARVDDLLEQIALEGESPERTDEALELALAYNFVTPYTSFLAIPESEVTDAVADKLQSARERKRAIQLARKDALSLSRSQMPPGDPVLSVRAPRDARRVLARFPFGLELELRWDAYLEQWTTRFLVPNDVVDGEYLVRVWIVHDDGRVEHAAVPYTIDSRAPDAEVQLLAAEKGVWVRVLTDSEPREVQAAFAGDTDSRVALVAGSQPGCRYGWLDAPEGVHTLRVSITDDARNERVVQQQVEIGPSTEVARVLEGDERWCD